MTTQVNTDFFKLDELATFALQVIARNLIYEVLKIVK